MFAANEARNATSLAGLDFVVRGDLDGKPLIEVHLTPEEDGKPEPGPEPRPCAVISLYDPSVVEIPAPNGYTGRDGETFIRATRDYLTKQLLSWTRNGATQ